MRSTSIRTIVKKRTSRNGIDDDKLKHWRGRQVIVGRYTALVLEFTYDFGPVRRHLPGGECFRLKTNTIAFTALD